MKSYGHSGLDGQISLAHASKNECWEKHDQIFLLCFAVCSISSDWSFSANPWRQSTITSSSGCGALPMKGAQEVVAMEVMREILQILPSLLRCEHDVHDVQNSFCWHLITFDLEWVEPQWAYQWKLLLMLYSFMVKMNFPKIGQKWQFVRGSELWTHFSPKCTVHDKSHFYSTSLTSSSPTRASTQRWDFFLVLVSVAGVYL